MDNLRLILLGIGVIFIIGIYVWEISRRENKDKKQNDVASGFSTQDAFPDDFNDISVDMSAAQSADEATDYADLGTILTQERDQILNKTPPEDERLASFYDDEEIQAIREEVSSDISNKQEKNNNVAEAQDVLVLYIKARYERVISGMEIKRAAKECSMLYGDKNIFHYFGVINPEADAEPLFSMANLYEPGEFDIEQIHRLRTKGLVLFMYPPKKDAFQTFEKFISSVQRLAASLGAEIHKYDHTALTKWDIDQLRKNYYQ